ncbi:MAG: ATPase [Alphaproteobacteria bacterium]|nr:ATPase [Alphaproteobacteria bacterium]
MSDGPVRIKRFYETVTVEAGDNAFVIALDGHQAKTQTSKPLAASTLPLAQAVANEWGAQGEFIERKSMPLTAILSAAIDCGADDSAQWRQDMLDYLGSDLVSYRAEAPKALVESQSVAWDPYIYFLRSEFDAALVMTTGVMAVSQSDATIASVRRALEGQSAETLFALRTATAITGSAVLSLALWKNYREASDIFDASRIDERFQEERWGEDEEARAREESMRDEFLTVGQFLSLI